MTSYAVQLKKLLSLFVNTNNTQQNIKLNKILKNEYNKTIKTGTSYMMTQNNLLRLHKIDVSLASLTTNKYANTNKIK